MLVVKGSSPCGMVLVCVCVCSAKAICITCITRRPPRRTTHTHTCRHSSSFSALSPGTPPPLTLVSLLNHHSIYILLLLPFPLPPGLPAFFPSHSSTFTRVAACHSSTLLSSLSSSSIERASIRNESESDSAYHIVGGVAIGQVSAIDEMDSPRQSTYSTWSV